MKLNEYIFKINRPLILRNIFFQTENCNSACKWAPENLANIFDGENLTFRIGRITKNDSIQKNIKLVIKQ
jgi:hypothetical protein